MRRWFGAMLVVVLVGGGIVAAVRSGGRQDGATSSGGGAHADASTWSSSSPTGPVPATVERTLAAESSTNDAASGAVPGVGSRVVKHATVELRVKRAALDRRFASAESVAAFLGGFVQSSERSGQVATITMRIPSAQFGDAISQIAKLGRVTARSERGDDVTGQFVDLEARIRNLTAQEGVLQSLMSDARTIPDTLAVQQQLSGVREQIEQLTGQRNLLDDQSSFATIAATFHTRAAVVAPAESRSTVAEAWHDAIGVTVAIFAGSIVVLGAVIPLGLIALVGVGAWALIRRRRTRVQPAAA